MTPTSTKAVINFQFNIHSEYCSSPNYPDSSYFKGNSLLIGHGFLRNNLEFDALLFGLRLVFDIKIHNARRYSYQYLPV